MYRLWPLSHQQIEDANGNVRVGALAYFYQSDATTPITTYQDYDLTTPHAWPVVANGIGVFPAVFLNEIGSFYRHIIKTSGGVTVDGYDQGKLPIAGPPVPVIVEVATDANALFKTGYPLWMPNSGALSSFVRMNGRTFGSASSGASESANADNEALFLYAWNNFNDTVCPVTTGRGANAAADWAANKNIAAIDMRGCSPFGLDDMGNSAASRLTGALFSYGNATTQASLGGEGAHALITAELAVHSHANSLNEPNGGTGHRHGGGDLFDASATLNNLNTGGAQSLVNVVNNTGNGNTDYATSGLTITNANEGGGTAHNNMPPFRLGTWYWKK